MDALYRSDDPYLNQLRECPYLFHDESLIGGAWDYYNDPKVTPPPDTVRTSLYGGEIPTDAIENNAYYPVEGLDIRFLTIPDN